MDRSIKARIERIKALLAERQPVQPSTLVYADGSRRSVNILEALEEFSSRDDVADVLHEDETTRSFLMAIRGPWDFSDILELED